MQRPLSLVEAASAIRNRQLSPPDLLADCLERIDHFEARVQAWVLVDRAGAFAQAQQAADELAAGHDRGPLHGIPIGVKDIVDVAGMPTRAGSALTSPNPVKRDATVVERLRAAGAVILGKAVTTEFACFDPSPTLNPWNLAHSPGGSSSGSAAAVALGMCTAAIGSQTGGSITRPASYCGIAGCKPTFGRVSRAGVVPVSFHLDHVGSMARTAADCAVLLQAMAGADPRDPAAAPRANFEIEKAAAAPRLGVIRPFFFATADREVAALTERAIAVLESHGAHPVEIGLPESFAEVHVMHRRLMAAEAADFHWAHFTTQPGEYGPQLAALLIEGLDTSMADYQEALRHQIGFQNALVPLLADVDALVTPATVSAAPGLETTGDPRFNSPWSYAGLPTVSIPCALTAAGLPISLQLIGPAWSEAKLLAIAQWCEQRLAFDALPMMCES